MKTLYLGYYGYGATKAYRYAGFKTGTIAVLEDARGKIGELEYAILENLAYSGSIFATYDDLLEHLKAEPPTREYLASQSGGGESPASTPT